MARGTRRVFSREPLRQEIEKLKALQNVVRQNAEDCQRWTDHSDHVMCNPCHVKCGDCLLPQPVGDMDAHKQFCRFQLSSRNENPTPVDIAMNDLSMPVSERLLDTLATDLKVIADEETKKEQRKVCIC